MAEHITEEEKQGQRKLFELTNQLNHVLTGATLEMAETAVALTVATHLIAMYPKRDWAAAVRGLSKQVHLILERPDAVEFIRSCISRHPPANGVN